MSLELRGIHKVFHTSSGAQHVLRGIDLTVRPGEFVAFIGHSGCGKSTLLNIVAGLLTADMGEVVLDGRVVTGPDPDRAMVFQSYSLLPWMSIERNVFLAVRAARPTRSLPDARRSTQEYLSAVGLWDHRRKRPAQISGGMRQRAAVARAFAVSPQVLLLDEPFGALDALTRARLQDQLIELWTSPESETDTVLMVTHGLDEAITLADRIVVMADAPGPSVTEVLEVNIPRPRDRATLLHDPEYRRLYARLSDLLMKPSETEPAMSAPAVR